jgi:predicted methyltransferase
MNRTIFAMTALAVAILLSPAALHAADKLTGFQKKVAAVMKMDHRSAKNRRRDRNRDPVKALNFCRLQDTMTVIDWAPGRG